MRYYAKRVGLSTDDYVRGVCSRDDWSKYEADLDALRGKRVWVVFSHALADERIFFLDELDRHGAALGQFSTGGVSVFHYDLGER